MIVFLLRVSFFFLPRLAVFLQENGLVLHLRPAVSAEDDRLQAAGDLP